VLAMIAGFAGSVILLRPTTNTASPAATASPTTTSPATRPSTTPRSTPSTTPSSTPRTTTPSTTVDPGAEDPGGSGDAGGSAEPDASTGAPTTVPASDTDWAAVAAKLEPSIVNIVVQLPNAVGAGTGIVISSNGNVLTNNHVVEGATTLQVTLVSTGQQYIGTVVGTNPKVDIAVVHLAGAENLTVAPMGDSDAVTVGDPVAAIGNAGGVGGKPTVAPGAVTALHQTITASETDGSNARRLSDLIQVDANVVPGESGGPLVDADANVIGVDVAGSVPRRGRTSATHEGFAIPIDQALSVASAIEADPQTPTTGTPALGSGYLGVQIDARVAGPGVAVTGIQPSSPAEAAGLRAGDTITSIDGTAVDADNLQDVLSGHRGGDSVTVVWEGADGRHEQSVTLGSR